MRLSISATRKIIAVALLVAAGALAWPSVVEFMTIDACLDSGGSFDYTNHACDYEASHPPGEPRSGFFLIGAIVSAAAGFLLLSARLEQQER